MGWEKRKQPMGFFRWLHFCGQRKSSCVWQDRRGSMNPHDRWIAMKGNMRIKTVWIGMVLGCAAWVQAQQEGGQAGAFLRYGIGGRALGMGKAFTAVADDASGVFWNPAGIIN